MPTDRGLA